MTEPVGRGICLYGHPASLPSDSEMEWMVRKAGGLERDEVNATTRPRKDGIWVVVAIIGSSVSDEKWQRVVDAVSAISVPLSALRQAS
ncbi:hypothetical protein CL629_04585 [bacterium]|nr:hypothetical protein [bacterium]